MAVRISDEIRKSRSFKWAVLFLKYGSAIVIAVLAYYGARGDKADRALGTTKAGYQETAKNVADLQKAMESLSKSQKDSVTECENRIQLAADSLRQNLMFFLLGEGKGGRRGERIEVSAAERQQLLDTLIQQKVEEAREKQSQEKVSLKEAAKRFKFSPPKSFEKIEQQSAKALSE